MQQRGDVRTDREGRATEPPAEPVYDTWGIAGYAGSWYLTPTQQPEGTSPTAVNAWCQDTLLRTLEAFESVARPWRVGFGPSGNVQADPVQLSWQPPQDHSGFVRDILRAAEEYGALIYEVEADLELYAYVRTVEAPERAQQRWVRLPSSFSVRSWEGQGDGTSCFDVAHTLFRPYSKREDDNSELYRLNAPLLEAALRRWQERFGGVEIEVDGLPGIYEYGYRGTDVYEYGYRDVEE